jgi:hypothetical protein
MSSVLGRADKEFCGSEKVYKIAFHFVRSFRQLCLQKGGSLADLPALIDHFCGQNLPEIIPEFPRGTAEGLAGHLKLWLQHKFRPPVL